MSKDTTFSEMYLQVTDERPWGTYTVLHDTEQCKVKTITVLPEQRLSYQSHEHRKEVWTCVEGQLTLIINDVEQTLNPGMSATIYPKDKHRAWNKTKEPVRFIEVQTGTYFGEDDIIRYNDDYGRDK